jgi:peroxiredoxin Q/BCP
MKKSLLAIKISTLILIGFFIISCGGNTVNLKIGDKAPTFCLQNQDNETTCLENYLGKWVVLYFYPKDNTPGCTRQAIEFTKLLEEFNKVNAVVIGISADTIESHCDFIDKNELKLILLSDTKKEAINAYGSSGMLGANRDTFIIDDKGNLAYFWRNVDPGKNPKEALAKIIELQNQNNN